MAERRFPHAIEEVQQRLADLQQQAAAGASSREVVQAALAELQMALEELSVAEEELLLQHEELQELSAAELEARQRYQDLFEAAPDGYLVTDPEGQIHQANQAAADLLGVEARFLVGKPLAVFVAPEARPAFRHEVRALGEGGRKSHWELSLQPRDAAPATASVTVTAATEDGAVSLRWILRDVTRPKRLEDELLRARHIASIGTLAGGIAHDFSNYLTAILGDIGRVRRRLAAHGEVSVALDRAEKTALLAAGLSRQLLTFAKGGAPVARPVPTRGLIEDSLGFALRGSNVTLRLSLPEDLWSAVADESQISQVLLNLVRNAEEAMPGGGTIEVAAENVAVEAPAPLPALEPGPYLRLTVADEGAGIAPEQAPYVFDPYFTTKRAGSGLGLATAHSVLAKHGGAITFSARSGGGTVFALYLPADPDAAPVPAASVEAAPGGGRVLVVDDEPILRCVVEAMLTDYGYQVQTAPTGAEAVARYRRALDSGKPFDAVLMDLVMPGDLSGPEAARAILALDGAARIIASSGYSTDAVMARYREFGFRAIAPKPYTLESLAQALREAMEGPHQQGTASASS